MFKLLKMLKQKAPLLMVCNQNPKDSVNKGMVVMLVEQTKGLLEKSFVYVHQRGGDDVK